MKKMGPYLFLLVLLGACNFQKHKLQNISGTVVSLMPPENFVVAPPHMNGFWNESLRATILVAEMPRRFKAITAKIAEGDTLKGGAIVRSEQEVEVDGRAGVLYLLNMKQDLLVFNQWMLVLPNGHYTTAVSGTYPLESEAKLSASIREAVLTARIEKDESMLFQAVPYEVRLEHTPLKLAKVLTGPSLVYTADGIWSDSSMHTTGFYIGPSYPLRDTIADREKFARENFASVCTICTMDTTSVNSITIDELNGFELWGYTNDVNHKLKYQVVLFKDNIYYLMVGTAIRNQEENLERFRQISRSFKRKEAPGKEAREISQKRVSGRKVLQPES